MNGQLATILAASITGSVTLVAALLAYIFGRLQKSYEVRYAQLFERRAEIVGELYSLIYVISEKFREWLSTKEKDDGSQDTVDRLSEQSSAIALELEKLRKYRTENDIWISSETWEKLVELQQQLDEGWLSIELPTRKDNTAEEAQEWVEKKFPYIREDLKLEFHRVLGVEDIQEPPDREPIIKGWWRVVLGIVSTTLVGSGVGVVLSVLLDNWLAGLLSGLTIGAGAGLLLEYISPSKKQAS